MKRLFKLLLISFLITFFWAVCFIDTDADKISSLLGFFLTGTFILTLEKYRFRKNEKIILLLFPVLYLIVSGFLLNDIEKIIYNPLNAVLSIFAVGLFGTSLKRNITFQLIFCILAVGYSYTFFPRFKADKIIDRQSISIERNQTVQLSELSFYNEANEEVKIQSDKNKFILTWNKTCVPCKKAAKDLKDNFKENPEFDFYFINIPFKENDFDVSDISSITGSNDNIYILNDRDKNLVSGLQIYSIPTFLIFDKDNHLIYDKVGYRSSDKNELIEQINSIY